MTREKEDEFRDDCWYKLWAIRWAGNNKWNKELSQLRINVDKVPIAELQEKVPAYQLMAQLF